LLFSRLIIKATAVGTESGLYSRNFTVCINVIACCILTMMHLAVLDKKKLPTAKGDSKCLV